MTDIRTITHDNVIRLRDALYSEKARTDELSNRVQALEVLTRTLLIKLGEVDQRSVQAFAIAQQGRL